MCKAGVLTPFFPVYMRRVIQEHVNSVSPGWNHTKWWRLRGQGVPLPSKEANWAKCSC